MGYRVVFEHPGQLFDLTTLLQDAADVIAATAGITFSNPPNIATLADLERFAQVELHLPEGFLDQLAGILFLDDLTPKLLAVDFFDMGVPFQVCAPAFFEKPLEAALRDANYKGRCDSIVDAKDLVVVCDNPAGVYNTEVDTYFGLENLLHFLRNKV